MNKNEWALKIGQYYFDTYGEAGEFLIIRTQFRKVEEIDGALHVHVLFPGLFIGRKGENVNKMSEYLKIPIKIHEVQFDILNDILWGFDDAKPLQYPKENLTFWESPLDE